MQEAEHQCEDGAHHNKRQIRPRGQGRRERQGRHGGDEALSGTEAARCVKTSVSEVMYRSFRKNVSTVIRASASLSILDASNVEDLAKPGLLGATQTMAVE